MRARFRSFSCLGLLACGTSVLAHVREVEVTDADRERARSIAAAEGRLEEYEAEGRAAREFDEA